MCEAVFRKEKQKIFIKNAGIEADEENEEISSVEYTYAGNRRDDFTYDANGNLTASSDGWTVTYNLLNLPASAVKNAGTDDEQTVEWSYLADGTKIAAYVNPSNSSFPPSSATSLPTIWVLREWFSIMPEVLWNAMITILMVRKST